MSIRRVIDRVVKFPLAIVMDFLGACTAALDTPKRLKRWRRHRRAHREAYTMKAVPIPSMCGELPDIDFGDLDDRLSDPPRN